MRLANIAAVRPGGQPWAETIRQTDVQLIMGLVHKEAHQPYLPGRGLHPRRRAFPRVSVKDACHVPSVCIKWARQDSFSDFSLMRPTESCTLANILGGQIVDLAQPSGDSLGGMLRKKPWPSARFPLRACPGATHMQSSSSKQQVSPGASAWPADLRSALLCACVRRRWRPSCRTPPSMG